MILELKLRVAIEIKTLPINNTIEEIAKDIAFNATTNLKNIYVDDCEVIEVDLE